MKVISLKRLLRKINDTHHHKEFVPLLDYIIYNDIIKQIKNRLS